jgi:DNA gyrase subunit A
VNIEEENGRDHLIVTSIPYQVNKAEMIKKTADLVVDKKIEGITDIRDESDKNGIRIVYELRKDAISNVVINKLYQLTQLQSSFSVNNIALVKGRPQMLNLKMLITHFVAHRHEVITLRTQYDLEQAQKRAHILEGLLIALDHIDEVIAIIRAAKTVDEARTGLMEKFALSDIQARAIVDMRLRSLVGLERDNLQKEYNELMKLIEELQGILADEGKRMEIIKAETLEMKEKYGDEPRTEIVYAASDFKIEDTIADEEVVITISHMGYIKRTPLAEYKRQNRGGRGSKGSDIRDNDFLEYLFVATMHNYMLFFTEKGKCFWMRVFEVPEGTKASKGRAIQNLINLPPDDKVKAFINIKNLTDKEYIKENYIILCTKKGVIKKTTLEAYSRPRVNGINAITVRDGDELLQARLTNGTNEVLMALRSGRAIRFNESKVRPMGRNASGVRGISLANDKDEVIGMICLESGEYNILVVSENGYGKRSELDDYRVTNRGGKGVKTINITPKTGDLISIQNVLETHDLMIINKSGIIIRMAVSDLRIVGRATQGVRLIKLNDDDAIAAIAKVDVKEDEIEIDENAENVELIEGVEGEESNTPAIDPDIANEPESEKEE